MRRALLSVSNKTGIVELARGLIAKGFEIVSTGNTAKKIREEGYTVTDVSEVTSFPEMMGGRVKTLHPLIHGGILARRSNPGDMKSASDHGIGMFDVVVVNLYPFQKTAADPEATAEKLIEEIDIGGPSLLRAAAKNFMDVLVLVHPGDYTEALRFVDENEWWHNGRKSFRLRMAKKAFRHTAAYDDVIAKALERITIKDSGFPSLAPPPTGDGLY